MTSTSPCLSTSPCETSSCANPITERPRYFPRQIITPDDLMLEQEYFRNKLRRHNRLMHGWGVVCGANVLLTPQPGSSSQATAYVPWTVTVCSGYVLGPYGDEILIDCCKTVDLRTSGTSGVTGDPCVQPVDPWCTEVIVQRDTSKPLYVAVKYKECRTRPVRVQPMGCGCNDNTCEYSRLQDGYEIGILTACPDSATAVKTAPDDNILSSSAQTPDCPECPSSPWVVLAEVTLDPDGTVTTVNNCTCRRIVASFGNFWRECTANLTPIHKLLPPAGLDLNKIAPGTTGDITLNLPGVDPTEKLTADLGPGIVVNSFKPAATAGDWTLNFTVQPTAPAGQRVLTVTAPTSSLVVREAVNVMPVLQLKSAAPAAPAEAPAGTEKADAGGKKSKGGSSSRPK
ncbi:MAG TPA: hypothetical protein VGH38_32895 [Bryobacteraceae bacterium]|jgi:hypothetical protein